jgi:predicted transcriptional regulator
MQTKQVVRELLDRLPEDCTMDEVLYHLYVLQAVQAGVVDADAGRVVPHAEVADALRRKWQLGEGQ